MGSGKSTLVRFLSRQLQRNRYPARFVLENTHPHPTNVMRALPDWQKPWLDMTSHKLIAASFQKWDMYVRQTSQEKIIRVFDGQLFHGDFARRMTDQAFAEIDVRKLALETGKGDWWLYRQQILDELGVARIPDRWWQQWFNALADSISDIR